MIGRCIMKLMNKLLSTCLAIFCVFVLAGCGVIEVRGKTFVYDNVTIDWGRAEEKEKEMIFEEFLVSNETELLTVLKTRNQRNSRVTIFGTDGKYTTHNRNGELLDSGYYKQDNETITLADTEDGFSNAGNFTLKANKKGYITKDKLNDEYGVFACYQYVVDE